MCNFGILFEYFYCRSFVLFVDKMRENLVYNGSLEIKIIVLCGMVDIDRYVEWVYNKR